MDMKIRPIYMLSTRDIIQNESKTHVKGKGMNKDISWQWKLQKSRSSNTYVRKNRL